MMPRSPGLGLTFPRSCFYATIIIYRFAKKRGRSYTSRIHRNNTGRMNVTIEDQRQPFETMTRGPFAALLRVPEDGFDWRDGLAVPDSRSDGKNATGPWLVRSDSVYVHQYSPLAVPDLYRRFVRTEPTAESILTFSNQYGLLGHGLWLSDSGSDKQRMVVGESLGFWEKEVEVMARLMALWDLVESGRRRELSHLVEWTPLGTSQQVRLYHVSVDGKLRPDLAQIMRQRPGEFDDYVLRDEDMAGRMRHWGATVLAHEDNSTDVELLERWEHGDPVEPARYFVHREVNRRLRGHVSPAVLPFRKGEIFFFPDCLLSSLYTQFMLELSGRSRPAILCERPGCGRYFEPTHGRQKYCERRCQQLAYYYRSKDRKEKSSR